MLQEEFSEFCVSCLRGNIEYAQHLYVTSKLKMNVLDAATVLLVSAAYQGHRDVVSRMFAVMKIDDAVMKIAPLQWEFILRICPYQFWPQIDQALVEYAFQDKYATLNEVIASEMVVAEWLLSLVFVHDHDVTTIWKARAFVGACCGGCQELAKCLSEGVDFLSMGPAHMSWLFELMCELGHLEVARWMISVMPGIDPLHFTWSPFRTACRHGHLEFAQWLLTTLYPTLPGFRADDLHDCLFCCYSASASASASASVSLGFETVTIAASAFEGACANGHLRVAQWIVQMVPRFDISAHNGYALRNACKNGKLIIVQWLFALMPEMNLGVHYHEPFRAACRKGHFSVVRWFLKVKPYLYEIEANEANTKIVSWNVRVEEDAQWQKRKLAVWMASDLATNRTIFNRLPPDVSRWIVEFI